MMKRFLTAFALITLLGGCACFRDRVPDSSHPQVFVVNGKQIVVSPEPLVFSPDQGKVEITWRLPKGSSYTFAAEKGIEIEGRLVVRTPDEIGADRKRLGKDAVVYVLEKQEEIVNCRRGEDQKSFTCTNLNPPSKRGSYKYTIRVFDGANALEPLDPWIIN